MGFDNAAQKLQKRYPPKVKTEPSFMDIVDSIIYNKWFVGVAAIILVVLLMNVAGGGSKQVQADDYSIYYATSHSDFARLVKNSINDPDSFELDETKHRDNGDGTITLLMDFRAKNVFGGVIRSRAVANFHKSSKEFTDLIID